MNIRTKLSSYTTRTVYCLGPFTLAELKVSDSRIPPEPIDIALDRCPDCVGKDSVA